MTTNLEPNAQSAVDAWTLLRPMPAPGAFVQAFEVAHQDGRTGVMTLLARSHAGPDGGQGLVDVLGRLERVTDARVIRPVSTGFAQYNGAETLYVVTPRVDGAALRDLLAPEGSGLLPNEVLGHGCLAGPLDA